MSLSNLIRGKSAPDRFATHTATTSRWWRIRYHGRDPVEVACCPEATHADLLEWHPVAIAAEPFEPSIRRPSVSMTDGEANVIRARLASIGETDQVTIDEVLEGCRNNSEARDYFLRRAGEAHHPRG